MTNFEKFKQSITIEEFAGYMAVIIDCPLCPCRDTCAADRERSCEAILTEWGKKEAEDNG